METRIKALREDRDLTQKQISQYLNISPSSSKQTHWSLTMK